MAIEKVSKVLIAVHKSDRDRLLRVLQRRGILHVIRTEAEGEAGAADSERRRTAEAVELLAALSRSTAKPRLTRAQFDEIAAMYDHRLRIEELDQLNKEIADAEVRLKSNEAELDRLRKWQKLEYDPQELYAIRSTRIVLGRFPSQAAFDASAGALAEAQGALGFVAAIDGEIMAIAAAAPDSADRVHSMLSEQRFESIDLRNVHGRPSVVIQRFEKESAELQERLENRRSSMRELARELDNLRVAADALANQDVRSATVQGLAQTETASLVYGWVRDRQLDDLNKIVEGTGAAVMTKAGQKQGEEPPVALVNRPLVRPFEMVLDLFSIPSPKELDPTWLIAPFFGVFFALCLTDAGYGIVVALIAYLLMRRMGTDNKLLGIILIGAVLTIPAGALVGGWFGDVPDRLGIDWLQAFKNRLMWFDPVKDPMKFFILSLALGYLQLIAGIVFEIVDCVRVGNYGDGLLVQLPWFVFLNGLVARFLFARSLPDWACGAIIALVLVAVASIVVFTQRSKETRLDQALWFGLLAAFLLYVGSKLRWLPSQYGFAKWVFFAMFLGIYAQAVFSIIASRRFKPLPVGFGVLGLAVLILYFADAVPAWLACALGVTFFFVSPAGKPVLAKLLWGGYALYGATGYIGVILSYIRLMALGMCTGGIAVAINIIAWMVMPVPVAGIVLAVIILIIGHTYNIAVNVLGAFVHSLRLQYVEFFPRFYSGGGERFMPFRENNQYVIVK